MKTFPELFVFSYSSSSYKADLPHKFKSVETVDHLSHMMTNSTEGCANLHDGFIALSRRIVCFVSFSYCVLHLQVIPVPLTVVLLKTLESSIVQVQKQQIELLEIPEHSDITQVRHRLHSRGNETYSSVDIQFAATV